MRAEAETGEILFTMKAEMPLFPFSLSVIAKTTKVSATPAFVMKFLVPLMDPVIALVDGVVFCMAASVPRLGSVSPNAPICSPLMSGVQVFFLLLVGAEFADGPAAKGAMGGKRDARARAVSWQALRKPLCT
jgi:hypothetical protein